MSLNAQSISKKTRILFILDASGSMNGKWENKPKINSARTILTNLVDSLETNEPNVEFGLRIFGHQHDKSIKNCDDTKLEVPFDTKNSQNFKTVLNNLTPKGYTPIAQSLIKATNDFPTIEENNVIILITDGEESCDGDPCAAAKALTEKNITLKPFVVGIGIEDSLKNIFDCIGTFYDAEEETELDASIKSIIKRTLHPTTLQINLIDDSNQSQRTNRPISLLPQKVKKPNENYIHSILKNGNPDTLLIEPEVEYQIKVHTVPPIITETQHFEDGKHNIVEIPYTTGILKPMIPNNKTYFTTPIIIRQNNKIITSVRPNSNTTLLTGKYDIEVLTLPRLYFNDVEIIANKKTEVKIKDSGQLRLTPTQQYFTSIYLKNQESGELEKLWEQEINSRTVVQMLPGNYVLIYRKSNTDRTILTQNVNFRIKPNMTEILKF